MRPAATAFLFLAAMAAGCDQPTMTRFDYDTIRLDVGGRVVSAGRTAAIAPDAPASMYCSLDKPVRQVMIEAKLVSVSHRDVSLLGVQWWPGQGPPIDPAKVENTTPKPPPVTIGFGFGTGGGGRSGPSHGAGCTCPQCRGAGRSSSGGGFGIGLPVRLGEGGDVTSLRATFDLTGAGRIDDSYLLVLVRLDQAADGKVLAQPMVLPMTTGAAPKPADQPATQDAATHVVVRDGQTLVIGGLMRPEAEVKSKVPVLNDIPMLGRLFKTAGDAVEKKDLVVFVTPRLVVDPGD